MSVRVLDVRTETPMSEGGRHTNDDILEYNYDCHSYN